MNGLKLKTSLCLQVRMVFCGINFLMTYIRQLFKSLQYREKSAVKVENIKHIIIYHDSYIFLCI